MSSLPASSYHRHGGGGGRAWWSSQEQATNPTGTQQQQQQQQLGVYVGAMSLRLRPGPSQWALSSAERLLFPPLRQQIQHFYTILQPLDGGPCTAFDFQPLNPEDFHTVFVALSGGTVAGVVLERKISRLPVKRCWKVGKSRSRLSMQDAINFNMQWDSKLQLWKHDCRHHTDALVEFLTGEREIVQRLINMPGVGSRPDA